MKKRTTCFLMTIIIAYLAVLQNAFAVLPNDNVVIPDVNFKASLVANKTINRNADSEIQYSEAEDVFKLIVSGRKIVDLTGIEAFVNLTFLNCNENQIYNLDISKNTLLDTLNCEDNRLNNLNITHNILLNKLDCSINQLTSLDLSKNISLTDLRCSSNELQNLDVSKNTSLTLLYFHINQITSIDVSTNIALEILVVGENKLTNLDLSKNTALTFLSCAYNQITTLDLSKNSVLAKLYINFSLISSLDLRNNTKLTNLYCNYTQLSDLDLSNNLDLTYFTSSNNKLLKSICISTNQLEATGWSKDESTEYITNCIIRTGIGNTKFNDDKVRITVKDGFLILDSQKELEVIRVTEITGKLIYSVNSKEKFIAISLPSFNIYLVQVNGIMQKVFIP